MAKLLRVRDPKSYVPGTRESSVVRIAGFDLGTNCGVAFIDLPANGDAAGMVLGQWDLSVGPYDTGPLRHVRLKQFLSILAPDLIMFEDVKFTGAQERHTGTSIFAIVARVATSIEFIGGLKVTLTTWATEHGIPAQGIGIKTIKKYATGKGQANKIDMIKACNERFGTAFDPATYVEEGTDNMADAAFVCAMGIDFYAEGLKK